MIRIYKCNLSDVPELAQMNRALIEDEQAPNTMSLPELEARMKGFLQNNYSAFFFCLEDGGPIGYALINQDQNPLYLRQFFICRKHRRMGYGKAAFHALLDFLGSDTIDIDVYAWNESGKAFWEALGFTPRAINMRYEKKPFS